MNGMKIYCPLCDMHKNCERVSDYKAVNEPFLNKFIVMCDDCKLVFMDSIPSEELLDNYYKTSWLNDSEIVSQSAEKEVVYKIQAKERVKYLQRYINFSSFKKVLDIGSGFGYLIDALKRSCDNDVRFYGTDPCPENIKRIALLGATPFDNLNQISEKDFDFITICYVLEHIGNANQYLSKIKNFLNKDGYLFIDVPERDDLFKPILEPHVVAYSKISLINLAKAVGFKLVHITGYGREQEKLIEELNKGRSVFLKIADKLSRLFSFSRLFFLYRYYKFNIEGDKRWWVRAIFQKI